MQVSAGQDQEESKEGAPKYPPTGQLKQALSFGSVDDGADEFLLHKNAAEEPTDGGSSTHDSQSAADGNYGLARLRKEKRLAMNRVSARNRRKRKKVLVETLEIQVASLKTSNQHYQITNE